MGYLNWLYAVELWKCKQKLCGSQKFIFFHPQQHYVKNVL